MRVWRHATAAALVVFTAAGLVTACGPAGEAPDPPSPSPSAEPPSASPTWWGPEISYEEAYRRIPIDGGAAVRLHWELPEVTDPDEAEALLATRRFIALDRYRGSLELPNTEAYLYQYVATRRFVEDHFPPGGLGLDARNDPDVGTVWVWVMAVRRVAPNEIRVETCTDIGWLHEIPYHATDEPRLPRAVLEWYRVRRERAGDGVDRWLVDGMNPHADGDLGPEAVERCDAWATHTP